MKYQIITTPSGFEVINAYSDDGTQMISIPADSNNSDYQAYLATLAYESANDPAGNK